MAKTTSAGKPLLPQQTEVTAVLANIDAAVALKARIADLKKQLDVHETAIKDAIGESTEGTDSAGNVVVRYPWRNRSNLDRVKVQAKMDPTDYAECVTETRYRTLLFGEG